MSLRFKFSSVLFSLILVSVGLCANVEAQGAQGAQKSYDIIGLNDQVKAKAVQVCAQAIKDRSEKEGKECAALAAADWSFLGLDYGVYTLMAAELGSGQLLAFAATVAGMAGDTVATKSYNYVNSSVLAGMEKNSAFQDGILGQGQSSKSAPTSAAGAN